MFDVIVYLFVARLGDLLKLNPRKEMVISLTSSSGQSFGFQILNLIKWHWKYILLHQRKTLQNGALWSSWAWQWDQSLLGRDILFSWVFTLERSNTVICMPQDSSRDTIQNYYQSQRFFPYSTLITVARIYSENILRARKSWNSNETQGLEVLLNPCTEFLMFIYIKAPLEGSTWKIFKKI